MATRTVDLGSVIGPRGPQGAAGPAGPAGADGMACRTARFVVGTSAAGWTADDCDYLCDGTNDQVEINAAITALPAGGGEVVLLDGTYSVGGSGGLTAGVVLNKDNVTLRGSGPATRLRCDRTFNTIQVPAKGCTIRDLYAYTGHAFAVASTGSDLTVLNTVLECGGSGEFSMSLGGSGGRVIGNLCIGEYGGIYASGSYHIIMGNRVTFLINTKNATDCVDANNITAA